MFTKINYSKLQKEFKSILKEEKYLFNILSYIEREYKEIIVNNIIPSEDQLQIELKCDNSEVLVNLDFRKDQTFVFSKDWPYSLVFANHVTNMCMPVGKLYQNSDRSIMDKSVKYLNTAYAKIKTYDLVISNNLYGITINEYEKKLDSRLLIETLLDEKNVINNINDLLIVISNVININDYEIKVNTFGNKLDVIILNNGFLTKYIYHEDKGEYQEKIYLEDKAFYRERTVKEKIEEDIPLVKRIGERK